MIATHAEQLCIAQHCDNGLLEKLTSDLRQRSDKYRRDLDQLTEKH